MSCTNTWQQMFTSMSYYRIIRIHYHPYKVTLPHEIDISMKKTGNCSSKCYLDIGILEYIHIDDSKSVRYHEWKRIYRLTWQVIAAKSRSFLVKINSTCYACTKLCDIAVALGLPLTMNQIPSSGERCNIKYLDFFKSRIFSFPEVSYERFVQYIVPRSHMSKHGVRSSDYMFGNWYDANAYCLAQNASLLAHASGLFKLLTDTGHGWKMSQELYYAGFHSCWFGKYL